MNTENGQDLVEFLVDYLEEAGRWVSSKELITLTKVDEESLIKCVVGSKNRITFTLKGFIATRFLKRISFAKEWAKEFFDEAERNRRK